MSTLHINLTEQAARDATRSFVEANGAKSNPTLEQQVATTVSAFLKGMDLTQAQERHFTTLVLNNEKRILAGKNSQDHNDELAMKAMADLRTRVRSNLRATQIIAATNAHLKAHRPDIHAALSADAKRGGSIGSEPFVVRHLVDYFLKHEQAADRASRSAKQPAKKVVQHASSSVLPGGLLSSHPPADSVIAHQKAIVRAAERTPASFDDAT